MYLKYALLSYFIFSGIIFAQGYSKSSANVKVKLINGVMFKIDKENLDFNELPKSFEANLKKEPHDGIVLHITGSKNGNIIINYGVSEIYKVNADIDKKDSPEASMDFFLFRPEIQVQNHLIDAKLFDVLNGHTFAYDIEKKNNLLGFLVGGTLLSHNLTLDGFYSGTFAVSLVYY